MADKLIKLTLPALRGFMGDWTYYLTVMRMSDIAVRIRPVADIHKTQTLSTWIQRELQSGHAKSIKDYLISQPQRLFNALVIGVYGGSPQWTELSISNLAKDEQSEAETSNLEGILGFLSLNGDEELFAIDGQHRVVGIAEAIRQDPNLSDEEVSILFVAHMNDEAGLERTRRLFTVLNRHAKIVGKMQLIALDDDDPIAITTRRLADEYPLFQNRISTRNSKNLSLQNHSDLTSIVALYDSLDIYFKKGAGEWSKKKKKRPSDIELENYYTESVKLFQALEKSFKVLSEVKTAPNANVVVKKYRNTDGGNLIFRPIGFQLLIQAVRVLVDSGINVNEAAECLSRIPWNLNEHPWAKLLWNPTTNRMITSKENQKLALKIMIFSAGKDLTLLKTDERKLREELAEVYGIHESKLELKAFTS